jgi:hypothetical protein
MSNKNVDIQKLPTGQHIISVSGENFLFFQKIGEMIEIGPMEGTRMMYEYAQTYKKDIGTEVLQEMVKMKKGIV